MDSPADQIRAFRVYVSGEAATFDSLDTAIGYIRSQAGPNNVGMISLETVHITAGQYAVEVDTQEKGI